MGACADITVLESMPNNNCGLYASGRVFCWGHNNGTLTASAGVMAHRASPVRVTDSIGRPLEGVRQIATGDRACVLLRDGTVRCWGPGVPSLGVVTGLASIQQIHGRASNFCAVAMDGRVYCWNGVPRDTTLPALTPVVGVTTAVEVAAGANHACARLRDNTVVCWGTGTSGQLGDDRNISSSTPVVVAGITDAIALTAGQSHTCVIRVGGSVQCWGLNTRGQLGNGGNINATAPVFVLGLSGVAQVRAGLRHTCAVLTSGGVRCWGENLGSQLGDATTTNRNVPVVVAGLSPARWVSAYDHHSCAITRDNRVFCWGYNPFGESGGGTEAQPTPVRVTGLTHVVDLQSGHPSNFATGAGTAWRCALVCPTGGSGRTCPGGGSVQCWGSRTSGNEYGGLADGTTIQRSLPAPAMTLTNVRQLAILYSHGCALRTDRTVACWGYNASGQIGDGTTINRLVPTMVSGLNHVEEVRVGTSHSCAIVVAGTEHQVWCWGYNFHGELGNGTAINSSLPLRVPGITDAVDLSMLANSTCVRRTAGSVAGQVWCWGRNLAGELGDGSVSARAVPGPVIDGSSAPTTPMPQTGLERLLCAHNGCWARHTTGTWVGWGPGIGSTRAAPLGRFDVADYDLDGNMNSQCVIRSTGVTVCKGYNEFGNNGNGMLAYYDNTYRTVVGDYTVLDVPYSFGGPCAVERAGTVACWGWTGNDALLAAGVDGITRTPTEISPP
jgi:alpha-tubulin suppressor-like RCC1 family protein